MANKIIDILLRHFLPSADGHLSDKRLADLFCRELSPLESCAARQHLAKCLECRLRQQRLEGPRAERMLQLYRESLDGVDKICQETPRRVFASWLELQMQHKASQQRLTMPLHFAWRYRLSFALPAASIGVIIGLAAGVPVFSFISWIHVPDISTNTLLVCAEKWDTPSATDNPGVVRQVVQIKTAKQTLKRSIYWDVQGRRRPKQAILSAGEEKLRSAFVEAGIDWNQPISASAYQAWHDHQHVRADRIVRSGIHQLTLTTTVPDGEVSEESLTVRDTDFHPVARKVGFRDSETVEIAELDFTVLPWNAVDASVFEHVGDVADRAMTAAHGILPPLLTSQEFTAGQLDETELSARLILNQLHADTGEQIEISRTKQGVELKGLVETNDRKRALQAQLATVPHLAVSIQSAADLRDHPGLNNDVSSVRTASMLELPSPLETYLLAHGRSVEDINSIEQRLFDNALTISQESKAIDDLQSRFVQDNRTTVIASAMLAELIYSHRERLQDALKRERELLSETQKAPAIEHGDPARKISPLLDAAVRNLLLCKELTLAGSPNARSAEKILAEMSGLLNDLTVDSLNTHAKL
jgi:hypothetical protein